MAPLLCLLLFAPDPMEGLKAMERDAREEAVRLLACGDLPTGEICRHLKDADSRVAAGVASALGQRGDPAASGPLAGAAGVADPDVGAASASALVELGVARGILLEEIDLARVAGERVALAVRALVERCMGEAEGMPYYDLVAPVRPLLGCGHYAAEPLRCIAGDAAEPWTRRGHALHALARLLSEGSSPDLLHFLDDPEPRVRGIAAQMLLEVGTPEGAAALAATLGRGRVMDSQVRKCAVAAVEWRGAVDGLGRRALEQIVISGELDEAVAAARALRRLESPGWQGLVRRRVEALLASERKVAGAGVWSAFFELEAGPLEEDLRMAMAESRHPLLHAVGLSDRKAALEALAPLVGPEPLLNRFESLRMPICYQLLRRWDAGWELKRRFFDQGVASDVPSCRTMAVRLLEGAPEVVMQEVKAALERFLDDPRESVRIATAQRLGCAGRKGAMVLAETVLCGDPGKSSLAGRLLREQRPDLPPIEATDKIAGRRRAASRILLALYGTH